MFYAWNDPTSFNGLKYTSVANAFPAAVTKLKRFAFMLVLFQSLTEHLSLSPLLVHALDLGLRPWEHPPS